MSNNNKLSLTKALQRISFIGLGILLISLPVQIHIFSQSNRIDTANLSPIVQPSVVSEQVKLATIEPSTDNQAIKEALEAQKNTLKELKIPLPKVIKPQVVIPPKIENKEPEAEAKAPSTGDPSLQELKSLISANCTKYNCNPDQLIRVMMCESGGTNHRNTFYKGPFQFLASTYYANAKRVGIENADILDARQQVQVAAYMFGIGQGKQWGCK